MSTNKPRDFKSRSKRRRSESERDASKHDHLADEPREYKNKRQKSKRAASPTPSYLSMKTDWSMDPPTNFKTGEMFPSHSRTKRRRETSPVTSYMSLRSGNSVNNSRGNTSTLRGRAASPTPTMKTDWSMDPPTNFKAGLTLPVHARGRADSPTPTLKTDWSMDPPTNFKPAETLALDSRLLTEHHLQCPLCKSMLKDPVSISCGHNYCRDCIDAFWDNCAEDYVCPHCGKSSEMRPVLNTNIALAEVVKNLQQAGFSPALPPQSYAGPEDVACDFCSERRLKAVKSCSNCEVFLCETHIRQHYTIAALQKHTLYDVTGDMKTKPSQQQNTVSNFSGITSEQQGQTDKTQVIIKETPVKSSMSATKLQTPPKKSVKISRPKSKDVVNKNIKHLARVCSTLRQEVSGLKNSLSQFSKGKSTKKEKHYEEDYGDEDDDEDYSEKDSDKRSDDEESHDEDEDGFENSRDDEEDGSYGSENYYDEEDDFDEEEGDEGSRDDEEDGSENYYDEEDDFDEEEGDEGSRDDEEDNSEYNDEGSDDRYSDGSNDHSDEEYSGEDDYY